MSARIGYAVDDPLDYELALVEVQARDMQVAARQRDIAALGLEVYFLLVEVVHVLHAGDQHALAVVDVYGVGLDGLGDSLLFHMNQLLWEYDNKYDGTTDYMF